MGQVYYLGRLLETWAVASGPAGQGPGRKRMGTIPQGNHRCFGGNSTTLGPFHSGRARVCPHRDRYLFLCMGLPFLSAKLQPKLTQELTERLICWCAILYRQHSTGTHFAGSKSKTVDLNIFLQCIVKCKKHIDSVIPFLKNSNNPTLYMYLCLSMILAAWECYEIIHTRSLILVTGELGWSRGMSGGGVTESRRKS